MRIDVSQIFVARTVKGIYEKVKLFLCMAPRHIEGEQV